MGGSVRTTNEHVGHSIVLVFTEDDEAPVSEWVKRVRDRDFACQNSGIMNCLPMPAVSAPPICTPSCAVGNRVANSEIFRFKYRGTPPDRWGRASFGLGVTKTSPQNDSDGG
jgi:hypothetical protein